MCKISNWVKFCLPRAPFNNCMALDLACGKGRHALYLSQKGYKVIAVDINKENLKCFSGKNITKLLKDIENQNNWPLTSFKFDIIIITNFLNRSLFPLILKSMKKGGFLIYETFSEGHQKIGKPKNPNYILKPRELISLCSKISLISYEEIYSHCPQNHYYKQRIFSYNV